MRAERSGRLRGSRMLLRVGSRRRGVSLGVARTFCCRFEVVAKVLDRVLTERDMTVGG
jgi:hypothetical protein